MTCGRIHSLFSLLCVPSNGGFHFSPLLRSDPFIYHDPSDVRGYREKIGSHLLTHIFYNVIVVFCERCCPTHTVLYQFQILFEEDYSNFLNFSLVLKAKKGKKTSEHPRWTLKVTKPISTVDSA